MINCDSFLINVGVAPDRQKVMIGGVVIQDDDWGKGKSKIKEVGQFLPLYSQPNHLSPVS